MPRADIPSISYPTVASEKFIDNIGSSTPSISNKTKKIAIAVVVAIVIAGLVLYFFGDELVPPSPPPPPPPPPPPANLINPNCTFNPTGDNKDNFTVPSTNNINLFPNDVDYTRDFTYEENTADGPLLCKSNDENNKMYVSEGPTVNGYQYGGDNNQSDELFPGDGTSTRSGNTCTWNPKANICNIPVCNLESTHFNIENDSKIIKQFLNENEFTNFKNSISCLSNKGEKYGKCSSTSGTTSQCDDIRKQNNKIDCLGSCSNTAYITKDECEANDGEWTYNETSSACQYETLNKPKYIDEIHSITPVSSDSNGGNIYKMCNNPGDTVNLDQMFDRCTNKCYLKPNTGDPPIDTTKMPYNWMEHCMFTDEPLSEDHIFRSIDTNEEQCSSNFFQGKIIYNFCHENQNCDTLQQIINNSNPPITQSIDEPCKGGGDVFEIYNNCNPVTCSNIYSGNPEYGAEFNSCPAGKMPTTSTANGDSLSPPVNPPPVETCNPESLSPSPGIREYLDSHFIDNCCTDLKCNAVGLCPNGPNDLYKNLDDSTDETGASILFSDIQCEGSQCNITECCKLKTCKEYIDGSTRSCNSGYLLPLDSQRHYVLPPCCNGVLVVEISLRTDLDSSYYTPSISRFNDDTMTNILPSIILKKLLNYNGGSDPTPENIDASSINDQATQADKRMINLPFINNETTFMQPPQTSKDFMQGLKNKTKSVQMADIANLEDKYHLTFYIVVSQTYLAENIGRFSITKAWSIIHDIASNGTYDTTNVRDISVKISDCRKNNPDCEIADDRILGQEGYESQCCIKPICGDLLRSITESISCDSGNHFDEDAFLVDEPTNYNAGTAKSLCCVSDTIQAVKPALNPQRNGQLVDSLTVEDVFGNYVAKKNPGATSLILPENITFSWTNDEWVATSATYAGSVTPTDAVQDVNRYLADNYQCSFQGDGGPTPKFHFDITNTLDGDGQRQVVYKITGCDNTDNIFCKIPKPYDYGNPSRDDRIDFFGSDEDGYDIHVYNLTGMMSEAHGNFISMSKFKEIDNIHHPSLNPNYGGIVCSQEGAGLAEVHPCDEPYGYIKFRGCNSRFDRGDFQYHHSDKTPDDCPSFGDDCEMKYGSICRVNAATQSCEAREFPINPQAGEENRHDISCSAELKASDTFSDAYWLEGFTNLNYEDAVDTDDSRGASTRVIQTPDSPSPSRYIARRTNMCGYTTIAHNSAAIATDPSDLSIEDQLSADSIDYRDRSLTSDSSKFFHSRVLDSTWLCGDNYGDCEGTSVNLKFPQNSYSNLESFSSFFNGDPFVYNWDKRNLNTQSQKVFVGSTLYEDAYNINDDDTDNPYLEITDYRPLQGVNSLNSATVSPTLRGADGTLINTSPGRNICIPDIDREVRVSPEDCNQSPSPGESCPIGCILTPIDRASIYTSQGVKSRIDDFTEIQNLHTGENDISPSSAQMEYIHNNIKKHNNYASMCGDNKYLRFFDYETMIDLTGTQSESISQGQNAATFTNPEFGGALAGDALAGDAVAGDAVAGDAVAGDAVAGEAVAGEEPGTQGDSTTSVYTNLNKSYQKCVPCRYQRDSLAPSDATQYDSYRDFFNSEMDNFTEDEKRYIQAYYYPTMKNRNSYDRVFLSDNLSPAPSGSIEIANSGVNTEVVHNYANPNIENHKMGNCTYYDMSDTSNKRHDINLNEYSTHFVPWVRESSANDLKVTDDDEGHDIIKELEETESSMQVRTCDLHRDRCEGQTRGSCTTSNNISHMKNNGAEISMCEWSGGDDGKCITKTEWRDDQSMCGYPCLSRMDAKPRECKFSDDCEIRDRYKVEALGRNAQLYCDEDGRNPIIYGNVGMSSITSDDNTLIWDESKYCNDGYLLIDIGQHHSDTESPTPSSNNTIYKCLTCDEYNSYIDYENVSDPDDRRMIDLFDEYATKTLTPAQLNQYVRGKGGWSQISSEQNNSPSPDTNNEIKRCRKERTCTALLWPRDHAHADPVNLKDNRGSDNMMITGSAPKTGDGTNDKPLLYTQDPAVAHQQLKAYHSTTTTTPGLYSKCLDYSRGKTVQEVLDEPDTTSHPSHCKEYFQSMKQLLGLSTMKFSGDDHNDYTSTTFSNYEEVPLDDKGIVFECKHEAGPFKWRAKDNIPTDQAIDIHPGGMWVNEKYKPGQPAARTQYQLCPSRDTVGYDGRSENGKIEHTDRHAYFQERSRAENDGESCWGWPDGRNTCPGAVMINHHYCRPLLKLGNKCSDFSGLCEPNSQMGGAWTEKMGQCGCDGSNNGRCWVSDLVCLGGGSGEYECTSDRDCNGYGPQSRINRGTGKRAECYDKEIESGHWYIPNDTAKRCK